MPSQISIHALLAESDADTHVRQPRQPISIHALLAESDMFLDVLAVSAMLISIHALLAESDFSMYGALPAKINFYPRSPCGERHIFGGACQAWRDFYPRSPCGERLVKLVSNSNITTFLSTLSLRRATDMAVSYSKGIKISIHALLAESDHLVIFGSNYRNKFLSTLSLRRATASSWLRI